jgi:hypothetical protein
VRTDATGPAVKEMMAEAEGMISRPVTSDELVAKESVPHAAGHFMTTASTAGTFGPALPSSTCRPDYYQELPARSVPSPPSRSRRSPPGT